MDYNCAERHQLIERLHHIRYDLPMWDISTLAQESLKSNRNINNIDNMQ